MTKKKKDNNDENEDINNEKKDEQPKSKSFRSIEEILNISKNESLSFDDEVTEQLEEKVHQANAAVQQMKEEFNKIRDLGDDDFSKSVLKSMIEKAMTMLAALQTEIIDNPSGRAVETAAAMVSAINNLVETFNKHKVNLEYIELEKIKTKAKLEALEYTRNNTKQISNTQNNTTVFVGNTSNILDMLASKGIIPSVSQQKIKEIIPEKIEENK